MGGDQGSGPDQVEAYESVSSIETEWEQLADRSDAPPFMEPGWIGAWWEAFGQGELRILACRREGRLVGVLPLARHGGVLSSPTNWHTPEFGPVFEERSDAAALARALFRQRFRRVRLSFLDSASDALAELRAAARSAGYRPAERVKVRSPFVAGDADWETYWQSRSGNHRSGVRRLRRRLEERGSVSLEVFGGGERLAERLQEAFEIEASGWKGEQGTAILSNPETRRFYEQVARWAARRGVLRLAFLRVDGRAVAVHLSLEANRRYYMLKPGFDPSLSKAGPGKLLDWEMVERVFTEGLESFEFLGADDPYKLTWADDSRERIEFQAFSRSPAGMLDRLAQTRGRALARRVIALRR